MKRKTVSLFLTALIVIIMSIPVSAANTQDVVTRGDFLTLIQNKLNLAVDEQIELPKDVKADSPYAESLRAMMGQKVIAGYPDGTVKLNQAITSQQAVAFLGRILGVTEDTENFLKEEYGISFENQSPITMEMAQAAVQKALTSDAKLLELIKHSTEKQLEQTSYSSDMQQSISITPKKEAKEAGELQAFNMNLSGNMKYHQEKGIKMTMSGKIPMPGMEDADFNMEQYIVAEGLYMKINNPETGEEQWIHTVLPIEFEKMLQLQKDSQSFNNLMTDKYFFYRDKGKEVVDGKTLQKVGFSGRMISFEEISKIMNEVMQDNAQALEVGDSLANMDSLFENLTMSGTLWLDEETLLPAKTDINMIIRYNQDKKEIPLESVNAHVAGTYADYNQVEDIVLPEAAKQAVEIPSPFLQQSEQAQPVQ